MAQNGKNQGHTPRRKTLQRNDGERIFSRTIPGSVSRLSISACMALTASWMRSNAPNATNRR